MLTSIITLDASGQSTLKNAIKVEIQAPYQAISPLGKYRYDSLSYEKARTQTEYEFEKFVYESDGFLVEAFSCRPKSTKGSIIPAIIYNRGGTGNIGRITEEDFPDFYALAKEGFVVFASNYRFVGDLGGVDQIGGAEVNDVLNLHRIIQSVDYVDKHNIFMFGVSRGGLMTYKSLAQINLSAAAVIGGIADFEDLVYKRSIFLEGWSDLTEVENYEGLHNILPKFEENREEILKERSVIHWAEEINTPIFLLHSRQDGRVPINGTLKLIERLQELGKEYKVKIYNGKSHSLPYSKFDSFEEIVNWFRVNMK